MLNFTQIDEEIWIELVNGHLLPQVNYVTELILKQLMLSGQILLKRNSYNKFHEHLTSYSVTDTGSSMEGQSPHKNTFFPSFIKKGKKGKYVEGRRD